MSEFIVVHGIRIAKSFEPKTNGRLTTIGPKFLLPVGTKDTHHSFQVCQCVCGEIKVIESNTLRPHRTTSCGCARSESIKRISSRHLGCGSVEYICWVNMIRRCYIKSNKKYHRYGGRGIRVCDRWLEPNGQGFINFLSDMGERPSKDLSLDRHPNRDGNYEPGNCRWATLTEQNRNTARNVFLTHEGKTQCIAAWAKEVGIDYDTIYARFRKGWDMTRILAPVKKRKKL
jgi:hypothetical protein